MKDELRKSFKNVTSAFDDLSYASFDELSEAYKQLEYALSLFDGELDLFLSEIEIEEEN